MVLAHTFTGEYFFKIALEITITTSINDIIFIEVVKLSIILHEASGTCGDQSCHAWLPIEGLLDKAHSFYTLKRTFILRNLGWASQWAPPSKGTQSPVDR